MKLSQVTEKFCFCKKQETLDKAINLIKTISE